MTAEYIRPSSLSTFTDCPKRAFTDVFPQLCASKGYELTQPMTGIAAIVGTAAHAGIAHLCKGKPMAAAIARSKNVLLDEVQKAGGVTESLFDKTTQSLAVARAQLAGMCESYGVFLNGNGPATTVAIEERITAQVAGIVVAGSPDRVEGTQLIDVKTGQQKPHQVQLGAYILLLEANGVPIETAVIHHVKRSPNVKQPPVWVEAVDVDIAKQAAAVTIQRFDSVVQEFAATGDKWVIPENPNSGLCSKKYCAAYGTSFCSTWRPYVYASDRRVS